MSFDVRSVNPAMIAVPSFIAPALVCWLLTSAMVEGTAIIVGTETKEGVTFTVSGSLNLEGAVLLGIADGPWGSHVNPNPAFISVGQSDVATAIYDLLDGPSTIGPGGSFAFITLATSTVGDKSIGLNAQRPSLLLPVDYISGNSLTESSTFFEGESLASLHLEAGAYTWQLPNDTVTLRLVPELSTAVFGCLGVMWLAHRRYRLPKAEQNQRTRHRSQSMTRS